MEMDQTTKTNTQAKSKFDWNRAAKTGVIAFVIVLLLSMLVLIGYTLIKDSPIANRIDNLVNNSESEMPDENDYDDMSSDEFTAGTTEEQLDKAVEDVDDIIDNFDTVEDDFKSLDQFEFTQED